MQVITCSTYTMFIDVIESLTIRGMAFNANADSLVIHVKGY